MKYLRVQQAASGPEQPKIDYKTGIIRGVSVIQAVEALGHGVIVDQTTLQQVADGINGSVTGIKSRFTHPGMCDDGTGSYLGKIQNATIKGDKVLADLQLSQRAKNSPKGGDLYSYVLGLAEEAPEDFGLSVAVEPDQSVWKLKDGSEVPQNSDTLYNKKTGDYNRPASATTTLPILRVKQLKAVDVVGEPAANRDGLFADTSSALSDETFLKLDQFLAGSGIDAERAFIFAMRYFAARGVKTTTTAGLPAIKEGHAMKPEELKALKAKHPDHAGIIVDMFADGHSEAEIVLAIETATREAKTAELSAKVEKIMALAEKERADSKASLQAKDDQIKKLSDDLAAAMKIAELGKGSPAPVGGLESDTASESSDAALSKKWDTDKSIRDLFFGDKEAFLALSKLSMEPTSKSEDGRVGARSLAPKSALSSWEPINHKNVDAKASKAEGV